MRGWLLDTSVIASLIAGTGAPSVKAWAEQQDEGLLFLSVLTLGEYDRGIAKLPPDHPNLSRYASARDALEDRFTGRVLPVSDRVVRRWGSLAGAVHRVTGHPPPVIDTLFAATALENDLGFVTRNVKDVEATGVQVLNPWAAP